MDVAKIVKGRLNKMEPQKILVTGAAGFIGSRLVKLLSNEDYFIRCFVRQTSKISSLPQSKNIELFYGDMKDKESLFRATRGMDAVVHLAACTSEKVSSAEESRLTNVQGAEYLVEACQKNKVQRLVVVSSQSTKRQKQGNYGYTKKLADDIFMRSGLDWTIVKPTLVYGKDSQGIFVKVLKLVQNLPLIPIIGSGEYQLQWTYVDDLTSALSSILNNQKTFQKVYDLAGSERISFNELIIKFNETLQQKKKLVHVPFWLSYGGVKILSLLIKNPPVTTDNLLGLVQETSIDLGPAKTDFNYQPLPFSEGIKRTIWTDSGDPAKKNIGIIGLGKMGLLHASIINYLPNAQVTALFDVDQKVKNYIYSMNIRAPFFNDLDLFLNSTNFDAVFISVPPAFTTSTIDKCAAHKINFFVEKPLADSLERAEHIVDVVKKNNLQTSVGYMYSYRPIIQKAQEIISSGVLGKIVSFDSTAFITQVLSPKKGWRYQKSTAGGGCVSLHGTHLLYLLYYFFGLPAKISSKLFYVHSSVEDKAFAIFSYQDGMKGRVRISWSEKGYPKLTLKIIVRGENGSLTVEENSLSVDLKQKKGQFPQGKTLIKREELPAASFELGGEGYFSQDKDFIDSLFNQERVKVDVEDAYKIQLMLQSIYDSSNDKKEVVL